MRAPTDRGPAALARRIANEDHDAEVARQAHAICQSIGNLSEAMLARIDARKRRQHRSQPFKGCA